MIKTLYHGSDKVVPAPAFGVGKPDNDYGSGFYTTEDKEKAKEWACANGTDKAICNIYQLDTTGLNVLNLDEYGTLAWIAEVVANRGADSEATIMMGNKLAEKYKVDTSKADIIIGYRADDSYIKVVEAFLKNQLSIDEVAKQFKKGDLGLQVFIKSPKAFDKLQFIGYEDGSPDFGGGYGFADVKPRQEVAEFLNKREHAILLEGFTPVGITAREAIATQFEYNKDYDYYSPVDIQNVKKGKEAYDFDR